jgi:hypothetical protein
MSRFRSRELVVRLAAQIPPPDLIDIYNTPSSDAA